MRLPNTLEEEALLELGYSNAAGIDEAGRGAWAGPVVAAAVVLDSLDNLNSFKVFDGVRDSKLLQEKKREEYFEIIQSRASAIGVGIVGPEIIDEIGILNATKRATLKSLDQIKGKADFALLDALKFETFPVKYKSIIKGDMKVFSIAAASIIAKVTRDRIMKDFAKEFPGYEFENHKGYGTRAHRDSMEKLGICKIHRKSYAPVRRILRQDKEVI